MKVDHNGAGYIGSVPYNWVNIPQPERYQVTATCPDCGEVPANDAGHVLLDITEPPFDLPDWAPDGPLVIITCEGRQVINPVWVGYPHGEWTPPQADLPVWDGKGVMPY